MVDLPETHQDRHRSVSSWTSFCRMSAGRGNTTRSTAQPGIIFTKVAGCAIREYLDDYTAFWFGKGGNPRSYSFWAADSVWQRYCVSGDRTEAMRLLPDLIANYEAWEKSNRDANGLYWQIDDRDGMEVSIGGSGYRATLNSYQFGDALAIARIAELAGKTDIASDFREKAAAIKKLVQEQLWDANAQFFKVLPRGENKSRANVRELHGFTPWYFNLPDPQFAVAWKQAMDPQGFFAPFGLTTAEQRHPKFAIAYAGHECQWNGPVGRSRRRSR